MASQINVLLVDDHHILREGLKTLLEADSEVCVIASAETAAEGLTKALGANVQVAVIDISLPDHDGHWLLRQIRQERPSLPVLILSMHADPATVVKVLSDGASGYLTKSADSKELLTAIRSVHNGGSYLQPRIAPFLLGALRKSENGPLQPEFTQREKDVLRQVAVGQSNHQIAEGLFVSASTVKAHLRALFRKLGVSTRTEVVVEAIRLGLIDSSSP